MKNKSSLSLCSAFTKTVLCLSLFLLPLAPRAQASPDFSKTPDVVINTRSLSSLPKDIITIPGLKTLLTEDFVFYYRDGGADWMSVKGALARLAFEGRSEWPLTLLAWLMNGPAEVALWKGYDGKLKHFAVVIDQTGLKELIKSLAQAAASDTQLTQKVVGAHTIYNLKLPSGRDIFLTAHESRLFIFSDSEMSPPHTPEGRSLTERVKSFFGASAEVAVYGPQLKESRHIVTVSAGFLSFGYQAFFSGIQALRFEFSQNQWNSSVLTNGTIKNVEVKDWSVVPRGASLCLALPIDLKKLESIVKASAWLEKARGNAVACWYPDSKIYTPLIALPGDYAGLSEKSAEVKTLFTNLIGAREVVWVRPDSEDPNAVSSLKWLSMLPVKELKMAPGHFGFTREVGGRYGLHPAKKSQDAKSLGSKAFFRVKLIATPEAILFSPDDSLVDRGLNTLEGKFPSMVASLPPEAQSASLVISPEALAKLAKQSILDTLPRDEEALFRSAVSRHLFPNLEKFGKEKLQAASLGPRLGGTAWMQMKWNSSASK